MQIAKKDRTWILEKLMRLRNVRRLHILDDELRDSSGRVSRVKGIQPVQQLFYEPVRVLEVITAVAGPNFIDIRPPGDEVWLLDRLSVLHDSNIKRTMTPLLVGDSFSMTMLVAAHMVIANASIDQTILPTWHEVAGGLEQDHRILIEPLQLSNGHFFRMTGTAFDVGDLITFKYTYRRVI